MKKDVFTIKKRNAKIILIISIVILLIILHIHGFFTPYNYITAKLDIKENKIRKVFVNLHSDLLYCEILLGKKYGFEAIDIETFREHDPLYYPGIRIYNEEMRLAFIKTYGGDAYFSYRHERDSVYWHTPVR